MAAARKVSISQPAITQAISRLESQLGLILFERHSGGMTPTNVALLLQPRFARALSLINSNRITSAQARALIALYKGGSYAEASRLSGLAVATLHRSISDTEIALSKKLIFRRGRGIEFTTQGKNTARQLRLAENELQSALNETALLTGTKESRLSIGAMPLCRARLLPSSLVDFQKTHTNSDISIAEGSFSELIEPLRDGELDFLIGAQRASNPGADITQTPLFVDSPVFLSRKHHPLTTLHKHLDLKSLSEYPWIVPPRGTPLREQWEQIFEDAAIPLPKIPIECGSVITIRQILMETDYLTVLSRDQVAVELEADWLCVIGETPKNFSRIIALFTRKNWLPTQAQTDFVRILNQQSISTQN